VAGLVAGSGSDAEDQGKRNRNVDLLSILQRTNLMKQRKTLLFNYLVNDDMQLPKHINI